MLKGTINGSFASSLRDLGLDGRQISQLSSALQWQVSLQKLSKGTKFAILVSREYLGDKLTGQGNVEAIHIIADGKSYYGIQAANGRYYDKQGETLGKGFARYPLPVSYTHLDVYKRQVYQQVEPVCYSNALKCLSHCG